MYHPNDYNGQLQAETVSANRPPQFNESTCGYRCGWGCCEPLDEGGGGDGESDTTPTLIGSEDEDEAVEETAVREGFDASYSTDSRNNGEVDGGVGPIVLVDDFEESLELSQHLFAPGVPMASPQPNWDYDESVNSLENQAGSETHSSAASDRRSVGSASPYEWDRGMGGWIEERNTNRFPGYFCVTPLRLSPQFEHCRGPVAAHMASLDFSTLLDIAGEAWRGRIPVDDWAISSYSGLSTC